MARACGPPRWNGWVLEPVIREVAPLNIGLLDQIHFPRALVFLEPRLPRDRIGDITERLVVDEHLDAVLFGKASHKSLLVFPHTTREVIGHANVECAVSVAREDVHVVKPLFHFWIMRGICRESLPEVSRDCSRAKSAGDHLGGPHARAMTIGGTHPEICFAMGEERV